MLGQTKMENFINDLNLNSSDESDSAWLNNPFL